MCFCLRREEQAVPGILVIAAVVVAVVVVECYCFLIIIIVGQPQPWPPRFVSTPCSLFLKMYIWLRESDGARIRPFAAHYAFRVLEAHFSL